MLKTAKKRSNLSKILNKKFTNEQELHEKLSKYGITFQKTVTKLQIVYYLLRENNTNYATKLNIDDKKRVYLTR